MVAARGDPAEARHCCRGSICRRDRSPRRWGRRELTRPPPWHRPATPASAVARGFRPAPPDPSGMTTGPSGNSRPLGENANIGHEIPRLFLNVFLGRRRISGTFPRCATISLRNVMAKLPSACKQSADRWARGGKPSVQKAFFQRSMPSDLTRRWVSVSREKARQKQKPTPSPVSKSPSPPFAC